MKALVSSWAAALSLLLIPPSAAIAAPVRYDFQTIAETNGQFKEFRNIAINKSGTVAFVASQGTNNVGVFTGSGNGSLTTITGSNANFGVSINDAGVVAFEGAVALDNSGGGLYTGSGGAVRTVVQDGLISSPSINNRGSIAFRRVFGDDGPPYSVAFVAIDGRLTQIPDSIGTCQTAINKHDLVLFGQCAFASRTISISDAGQRPTVAVDTSSGFTSLLAAAINDSGTIAFYGRKDTGEAGVYTSTHGQVRPIATISPNQQGGYFAFKGDQISLNKKSQVAFSAYVSPDRYGIFTGPNPVNDKVIAVGDPLLGSTVTDLFLSRESFNDKGELAFIANLANGKQAVVRAAPANGNG